MYLPLLSALALVIAHAEKSRRPCGRHQTFSCNDNYLNDAYTMANGSVTGAGAGTSTATGSTYTAHITHLPKKGC